MNSNDSIPHSEPMGAPRPFSNKDPEYPARRFILAFERCLALNPFISSSIEIQIAFFATRLTGTPAEWLDSLTERDDPLVKDWISLKEEFIRHFSVNRSEWQNRIEMMRLFQGRLSVLDYTLKFKTLSGRLQGFGDEALLTLFYMGLNVDVQNYLCSLPTMPSTLASIIDLSMDFAGRAPLQNKDFRSTYRPHNDERKEIRLPYRTNHEEKSALTVDRHLTEAERQRRLNNDLCVFCGEGNHNRDSCPVLKQRNERTVSFSPNPFKKRGLN